MRPLTRREFLRTGAAVGVGLGVASTIGACSSSSTKTPSPPTSGPAASGKTKKTVDDLRKRLKGAVLVPGDAQYAAASAPVNGRYASTLPLAVAKCLDEADVVTCIKWSGENGIPPVPKGGGHSYAGYSTTEGLLIDIRNLNSVAVDPGQATAVLGGAALNQDAYNATHDGPLFLPGGLCLGVGIGGLCLGGGIGYQTHWAGLTCDHLLASRIVTASGEVLDIDPSTNSDLYWACRGGAGGNFGINTSFKFSLVEAPPTNVVFFRYDWRGADAAASVFSAFHQILAKAPAAFNAVASAQATPVGSDGPREAIDVYVEGQYVGPINELRDLVTPLLAAAPPVKQALQEQTFWDTVRGFAEPATMTHSFGDISRYADKPLPDSAVGNFVDILSRCPSRSDRANGSMLSLGWVGGDVVNSVKRTDTAYVHRNMLTLLRPTTMWPNDAPVSVGKDLQDWTDEMIAAIAAHTPAESYQNFPNRSLRDWKTQYYAENFPRLVDVKARFDKGNLFQNPQSIPVRI